MQEKMRGKLDPLLDLLTDEVARRLEERWKASVTSDPTPPPIVPDLPPSVPARESPDAAVFESVSEPTSGPSIEARSSVESSAPSKTAALMLRLAIAVFIVVTIINIPLNGQGKALARMLPPSSSLVIRNGLVVKEGSSPEIWVYRDGSFHWITSLEAFGHFGFTWQDVHIVEPGYLSQFDKGVPLYVLLKCDASPHIYRLEGGTKRWIIDIPTFQAEGYVWKDVESVSCSYLRGLRDGDSVPPGRGVPPPPLP